MKSISKKADYSISNICKQYDLTRDAFYKYTKRFDKREAEKTKVVNLVKKRRESLPREGCRKLHFALYDEFVAKGL